MDQYNNAYHQSINEKPINADYSALSENIESNPKPPKFKVNDKNILSKSYTENWTREAFIIDSVLKANPWTYKIKDLNGEKIIRSFYDKKIVAKYIKNKLLFRTRQFWIIEIQLK